MNKLFKFGVTTCLKRVNSPCLGLQRCLPTTAILKPVSAKSYWHMASETKYYDLLKQTSVGVCYRCNHTNLSPSDGEKDLVEFLQDEIAQEKKSVKGKLPSNLDDFAISTSEAELKFTKKSNQETVTVSMNVNHSVDTDEMDDESEFSGQMKSKPAFEVEIERGGKTVCFSCSYTEFEESAEKDAADNFQINEVTYFEGEYHDKTYSVAADILDENLYDLFMVVLSDKGITKPFVDKVSEIATMHEHSQYVKLLENLRKFTAGN